MTLGEMRARGMLVVVAVMLGLGLGGCESLEAIGRGTRPHARVAGVRMSGVTTEAAALVFDVEVTNPHAFALPVTGLEFSLATEGSPFVTGNSDAGGDVPAKGSRRIAVPVSVRFLELVRAAEGVRPGQVVPYVASFTFTAEAPAVGNVSLPVSHRGELPIPAAPEVELTEVRWQALSLEEARALMRLRVVNRNAFPLVLNRLRYALSLGGVDVAESALGSQAEFKADGGEQRLEVPLSFSPKRLGYAAVQMLGGRGAGYRIAGTMNARTPYGVIEMPYERSGDTVFRR